MLQLLRHGAIHTFLGSFFRLFSSEREVEIYGCQIYFVYKDRPDSSFFTEHCREKNNRKEKRDSFFTFNSGLSRAHCVRQISQLVFFQFLYKMFSVCPDFLCSRTHWFSPSSFHTHCLAPLPPLQVRFHPVSLHSGTRRGWSGSYASTPVPVLHYFGQLYLYFNHLLHKGDELLLDITPIYV